MANAILHTDFVLGYSLQLRADNCSLCGLPAHAPRPLAVLNKSDDKPVCRQCAGKYAPEILLLQENYYLQVSRADRLVLHELIP